MRVFGNKAWVGLKYLTAIVTLVAGFPHCECRCPNGQIKLFCFASTSVATGNPCCRPQAGTSPAPVKPKSCCGNHHGGTAREVPGRGSRLQAAGCLRVLASSDALALLPDKAASREVAGTSAQLFAALPAFPLTLPAPASHLVPGASHLLVSPTDLPVRLQRLVI
jgi:hypothetical protein